MYVCEKVVLHPRSDIYIGKALRFARRIIAETSKTLSVKPTLVSAVCVEQGFCVAPKAKNFCRSLQT